jgi:hypothetical protein
MSDGAEVTVPDREWKMLQDPGELPIFDAVRIDAETA